MITVVRLPYLVTGCSPAGKERKKEKQVAMHIRPIMGRRTERNAIRKERVCVCVCVCVKDQSSANHRPVMLFY